jgi:indolepyruvate ferredoxin oxidoreductase beta subunit
MSRVAVSAPAVGEEALADRQRDTDVGVANVLISGVGGQGVVLASYVLSHAALAAGFQVKQSEVHGMSQRGGSVMSHLRFGRQVWSPLVSPGTADVLLSFEALEALRYLHWLRPGGRVIYNAVQINPSPVAAGLAVYPADVAARIVAADPGAMAVDAAALAAEAGEPRAANMVMLGAVSMVLPLPEATMKEVIAATVPPKTVDANLRAFSLGRGSG